MAPFYVLQMLWEVGYPPLPSQSWRWSCHLFTCHLGPLFAWFAKYTITLISSTWQLAPFYRTGTIYLCWTMKKLMWTIHIGYKISILCREMFFRKLHSLLKSWRSHLKTYLRNKVSRTATKERALHCRRTLASYLEHACQTHVWESGTESCAEKLSFRPPRIWRKLNFLCCCF